MECKLVDLKQLEFEFGEDWDIFQELVSDYKDSYMSFFEKIKKAIDEQDYDELRIQAHTVKGIVSNFYCEELKNKAFALEQLGQQQTVEGAKELLIDLIKINDATLNEIQVYDTTVKAAS